MKMERSQTNGLTGSQMARIGRVLAEPRRVQMLREFAACKEPTPCTKLHRTYRVSAVTLSNHIKQLLTVREVPTPVPTAR
jgi:ArsR family transcriptional regulator, arsenate/arsenite/antimonite-responsive transcriptional repressor